MLATHGRDVSTVIGILTPCILVLATHGRDVSTVMSLQIAPTQQLSVATTSKRFIAISKIHTSDIYSQMTGILLRGSSSRDFGIPTPCTLVLATHGRDVSTVISLRIAPTQQLVPIHEYISGIFPRLVSQRAKAQPSLSRLVSTHLSPISTTC